jgi:hypothetical protein
MLSILLAISFSGVIKFLISILVVALLLWLVWWVITDVIGFAMPPKVYKIICAIIVLLVILWAGNLFFFGGEGSGIQITR